MGGFSPFSSRVRSFITRAKEGEPSGISKKSSSSESWVAFAAALVSSLSRLAISTAGEAWKENV